ncbi:putative MATE family efflux protein [Fusobacterium sp. PH5-7]|uniref:MATE family efflux transporter n=1 Tax=Fusobacterium sp. PH5-7 TaxID=2940528 RepID=UPI0024762F9E|nr:MATE family efflux transporter [Fusobacterium sp. PH5-7]MDH6456865.1 putative MATE family efflux protein [Fusobacterium sp. PH5-7]
MEKYLFKNRDLVKLFIPLIIEQFLEYLVGLIDSIMVAHVGEAAVSGVSLVDFVMQLLISIFAALATGGAVIAGQYLGKKQQDDANETANQLIWFTGIISVVVMLGIYIFKSLILHGLFGQISEDVYRNANIYLLIVAASIPFLAVYSSGAAAFRTMGNSKLPMKVMMAMNMLNLTGNAVLVYGFKMGTAGVAIPTLVSRIGAAVIILAILLEKTYPLHLKKTFQYRLNKNIVKQILGIGIPYGLENGMFYLGRLVILSLISTFGTAAIAANSVSGTIVMFEVLPGMAIGLGLTVIISRCVGMGDFEQARYYTKKIMKIIYETFILTSIGVLALLPTILNIYGLSPEATEWTYKLVWAHAVMLVIWPLGYTLPVTFRAAGDARFPMLISVASMIFCRIILAFVFSLYFEMGMLGTWAAMFVDWIVKAIIFVWRYLSGRWTKFHAVQ